MSSTLAWEPVRTVKNRYLSTELKFAIGKKYDCANGRVLLSGSDVEYLQGLGDAGIADAMKLIDAIYKYGEIYVWEVF